MDRRKKWMDRWKKGMDRKNGLLDGQTKKKMDGWLDICIRKKLKDGQKNMDWLNG